MSLAKRLNAVIPERSNRGCHTCKWVSELSEEDQRAWRNWVDSDNSLTQLWQICSGMDKPLQISIAGMRSCVRSHWRRQ
jgi:hypothetical protein